MAHKTNYKDALFEQRKYRMQNNPDGTVTPIDETDYTQEGDRVGALELNEIGEALNALEQEMGKRELQTYTALSQLSLEAPVTLSQLITAMPDGSYAAIDCNGTSVVSDIPSGSAAGSLEVVKVGNSGSAKYTNTSNGQVYFWGNGQWYAALVDEMVLGTMEEIDANTDSGKVAGALAVKELSSDFKLMKSEVNGSIAYVQGILPSTAGNVFAEADYPAGFSANNCCVICAAYYNNDYEGYGNIYNSTAPVKWFLLSEKIRVYNILSECTGMTFRIYLQKLNSIG